MLVCAFFTVVVVSMALLDLPLVLVSVAAMSGLAAAFAMALIRVAAAADRAMADEPREGVVRVSEQAASAEDQALALRVRRASTRWPLTELDPIERATFAGAVAQARDFDDLDLPWQELIIAAESGAHPHTHQVHDLARPT